MAIADRRVEEEYQLYRRRRRKQLQLIVGGIVAGVVVVFVALVALGTISLPSLSESRPPEPPRGTLFVNFGLSRAPVTRTQVVTYVEPSETSRGAAGSGPSAVIAMLATDLRDDATEEQFAAAQVQINASPIGPGRLQLTVIANPAEPQRASGGTYRGTVQVLAGTQVITVPLMVYLAPRDGPRAILAFALLLIGAVLGLAVKWITESLSRLATARWRLEDLRRSLGGDAGSLPLMAAVSLEEMEDRIRRQDTELDDVLTPLRADVLKLRSFATAVRAAEAEIDQQRAIGEALEFSDSDVGGLDPDFIESIMRAELTRIERARAIDWPWSDPDQVLARVQELSDQCSAATNAMSNVVNGRSDAAGSLRVLDLFRKGEFAEATERYRFPPPTLEDDAEAGEAPKRRSSRPRFRGAYANAMFSPFQRPGQSGLVSWMAERPRWFAGMASVFVVSLVGLQLQYLDVDDFGGGLGDWLGLLLWAAVVELSGVSVLDVLSRLGGGGAGQEPGARRGPPARQAAGAS